MKGVKAHVGAYQDHRFGGHLLVEPIEDARVRHKLPHDHGMGDGVVWKATDPGGFDKAKLGAKVGSHHSQLHRGQDRDGKAGDSHQEAGGVIGKVNERQEALGQMHQGNRLVKLAVAHQYPVGDWWTAVGKGGDVNTVVAERSQDQKGSFSEQKGRQNIGQVAPSNVNHEQGIGPCGCKDPPGIELFQHGFGPNGSKEIVTRPSIVRIVEEGTEFSVSMPALGVYNVMEFDERSALGVGGTRDVVNPVQFTVVIKTQAVVGVDDLGFGNVLEIEVCANHLVGSDTDQNTVERGAWQPPVGSILNRNGK